MNKHEYREVLTREGKPTGRIREKHASPVPGEYFRHVLVILKTKDSPLPGQGEGMYLMQQRSLKARFYAGKWDMTGGGVQAGESSMDACIREVQEELGLKVPREDLHLFYEYVQDWPNGTGLLISVYGCRVEIPKEGILFDPVEVNDVRVVPFSVFLGYVLDHNSEAFGKELTKMEAML